MARIEIKTEKARELTFIVFTGKVTHADLIAALKTFYESEITSKVLWNFTNCDVEALETNDLYSIADVAKGYAHLRSGEKSAFVASSNLAFGLGRMFTTIIKVEDHPIEGATFRSVDEALTWLYS